MVATRASDSDATTSIGRSALLEDLMKVENLLRHNEQESVLDENSPALTAHKGVGSDCIIIKIPSPEIIAQWNINDDDDRELKRIIRDLWWTDMITDALTVLAITGVIYFSPIVETMRGFIENSPISRAEASPAH
jgi:hypothetical protein